MNHNLKKYFNNINFFFLFLISILTLISYFFNLSSTYIYIFCFLLIATIGVSHGAYDGIKGKMLFYKKFKNLNFIFYFSYISLIILVLFFWYLNPSISLIIFLVVSSFHFGKEDLEIYLNKKYKYHQFIFFLKGSLIILFSLFFSFEQTNLIFNTIIFSKNYELLSYYYVKLVLLLNLLVQIVYYLYFYLKKKLKKNDFITINFEIILIIITFYLFNPIVAFTLYFCFMHSLKNILLISSKLNPNLFKGINIFFNQSLLLSFVTFFILLISLIFLINYDFLENSIAKIIFVGLASLTLPHIILHYFLENY